MLDQPKNFSSPISHNRQDNQVIQNITSDPLQQDNHKEFSDSYQHPLTDQSTKSTRITVSPSAATNPTDIRSSPWGDSTSNFNEDEDVRILFQNINGLSRQLAIHEEFKLNMARLQATLIGICESNVNWRNFTFRDQWESGLQRQHVEMQFAHSSCNEGSEKILQRGGTSMLCTNRLGSRLLAKGHDEELGRWSWMRFRSSKKRTLLILTAYQVSQSSPKGLGTETFYMQQWRCLRKKNYDGEPRAQFWKDLTALIKKETEASNADIIVMLDANAGHDDPSLSQFLLDCQLLDLHDDPNNPLLPETYFRGSKKIDFCFGSINVALAVSKSGILDYSDGLKFSDHRALFIDLKESKIFSAHGTNATHRRSRGLKTANARQLQKYIALFREKLDAHNVLPRCWKIREILKRDGDEAARLELESLDTQITNAALKAEKQCSRSNYGYPWSPTLANAGRQVTFWRNCVRQVKSGIDPAVLLIPSQITVRQSIKPGLNLKYYQARLDDAWTSLHLTQDNSAQLRQRFLEEMIATTLPGEGTKSHETRIKAILKAEYLQKLWPKLRRYAKGQIKSSLLRLEIPIRDEEGEIVDWRSIYTQDEICSELIKRNIAHFSQAKETPFVSGPFASHLHPFEQNDFSESILKGSVRLDSFNVNDAIKACIKEMAYAPGEDGVDVVDPTISAEDFKAGFRAISEQLTSSPSGRHYGHYKAVLQEPDLCAMYALIMSIPFELGFGLQRWNKFIRLC